ncbi:MAG: LacI family DNA-binding transcriptional regulator [Comamonas sp.]|uniref:LacI family DNA-binding transcriptional regulator n=1 Tax=Comamonas sp. TaxID=34028 RepID=UPI00281723D8|nr:LacI family DNA-binding transcriptional regulator [Comamonas sp.]MDR0216638.1 LacI family DNA-binding transcriptional regulator [Comamonas sp.]
MPSEPRDKSDSHSETAGQRRSRASGRVTLSDVAEAAGVSSMTVSRALRGERRVAPALVEKVREVAASLGYVPDLAARALASQKSTQVLVLIPMLSNTLFVDVIEAVHKVLFAQGYHMLIGVTHYDPQEEEQLLRAYLPMRPAGLLLTGFDHSEAAQQLLAANPVPRVHLMELREQAMPADNYCVGFSQTAAGAEMTRHLLDQGYRRIAFCGAQLDARVMQRLEGYRTVLKQEGLYEPGLEMLNPERSSLALGARQFEALIRSESAVDAIFFCNDDIAQGALLEAARMGIKVPEQVAIAGFNDLPGSDQMVPPLTTIRTPRDEVGERAANMLLQLLDGKAVKEPCVDLGFRLLPRAST